MSHLLIVITYGTWGSHESTKQPDMMVAHFLDKYKIASATPITQAVAYYVMWIPSCALSGYSLANLYTITVAYMTVCGDESYVHHTHQRDVQHMKGA